MTDGPLELRALLLLVTASAAFTVLCPAVYRREPGRRKSYLVSAVLVLLVAPWWSAAGMWTWPLGLEIATVGAMAERLPWLVVAVWWAGAALLITRTAARVYRGHGALAALPTLDHPAIAADCRRLGATLGLSRPVRIRQGPAPCASSLGGLTLVLPDAARQWPAATRQAVLAHELAHLRRRDDRLLLLVRLLIDWYWWMPWLIRMRRRYVEAMEESCDDLASAVLAGREAYVAGLVDAARSVRCNERQDGRLPAGSSWVALLGQSHLATRVERLLTAHRPTLNHADGRWAVLWSSLAVAILITARPSVPDRLPASAELFPVNLAAQAPPAAVEPAPYRAPRVTASSFLQDPVTGTWRRVPGSFRDPLPVYPARAIDDAVEGRVTVEQRLRATRSGAVAAARPRIVADDSVTDDYGGILAAAVERALARARGTAIGAGLRTVSVHNNDVDSPPPGTTLRLRKIYEFSLVPAAGTPEPDDPGAQARTHRLEEVEP